MSGPLDIATHKALKYFGDSTTDEFIQRMTKDRQLASTKCTGCAHVAWPPRSFCPSCQETDMEWVNISQNATLYAFTQQERSLRFAKPDVIAIVNLPAVGNIVTSIKAKFEELEIGMPLELDFVEITDNVSVHCFKPKEEK